MRTGACLLAGLVWVSTASAADVPADLLTRAESSGFRATSTYDETIAFLHKLESRSPYVRMHSFGKSEQGRQIFVVVASKEKVFQNPAAAQRLAKPIVLLQSGIHAGEIDGKDASLMLLRELALGLRPEVLDAMTLLVVPIYNVDGHERVSRFNRSNQDGPEDGMGFRTNARGLDLNRDHLKLESEEARALVRLVDDWRPHLHVDNHVSDGFDHAWELGVARRAPQAAPSVDAWVRAALPAVAEATRRAGHPVGPYLELLSSDDPAKGAITPPYRPRYSTGYFALRNRPSVLIETHSHKPFRTRVLANHAWMAALLSEIAHDPGALVRAVETAEQRTVAMGAPDAPPSDVVLRLGPDRDDPGAGGGQPDRVRIPFFAWSTSPSLVTGAPLTTYQRGTPRETEVPWFHTPLVTASVPRPRGYIVLPGWPAIVQRLRDHALRTERVVTASEMEVETLRVSEPSFAAVPYQGTTAVTGVRVTRHVEKRLVPAGAIWVPADQPDFEVAAHLLEPDAPDSLLAWGYLSSVFERKEWIDGPELERLARELSKDPQVAAEWETALRDPAFAKDPAARSVWWSRRTPYWDETIGLMPVYRALKPLTFPTPVRARRGARTAPTTPGAPAAPPDPPPSRR